MFKIQTQTVILLCEQVFTIFLCIGQYVLIEIISFKVAYTPGPIFEKNMKRYPMFSVQIINYQIDQKHK